MSLMLKPGRDLASGLQFEARNPTGKEATIRLEPLVGIEPTTIRLQGGRSTN
jgi:hypothetical protein